MKTTQFRLGFLRPVAVGAVLASLLFTGCSTVSDGPTRSPQSGSPELVRGVEPQPAAIPQRSVPEGQSSLRKTGADQPLVPASKP